MTQFIRRLADEPPGSPAALPQPAPPPVKSGPGEYTRVVARVEGKPGAPVSTELSASPTPLPGRLAMPALPTTPAVRIPLAPAPAASSLAAALPQKRTKLEEMAPVLLALNTVLLVGVLLLLILLLRSR
ncbi:MAG: hypothetical protein WBW84_13090 [Acidobacteriaceae bacterium]